MPSKHSDDEMEPEMIDFGKKKKKDKKEKKEKKEKKGDDHDDDENNNEGEAGTMVETEFEEGESYTYDDLLKRLHDVIDAKHSGLGVKEKFTIKPPQVTRCSAKKTSWVNFFDICKCMNRSTDHVASFVFAELGCDGTFAGEGQFILKGRFYNRNIESLLKRYIREYVMCSMCRASDTEMYKDNATRLNNIKCNSCAATRSCASIRSGFHATGKGERKKAKIAETKFQVTG